MALNYVSLTITEQDAGQGAAAGNVIIAPTAAVVAAGVTVVSQAPVIRSLASGTVTVSLVATDNAGTTPAAGFWAYNITLPGATAPVTYLLKFSDGASQQLSNLTPVTAQTTYGPAYSSGTVTGVSVVSANGLAGSVATPSTTPAITLSTTVTGLLKGNGTAISAAAAGTDYLAPNGNGSQLTGLTEAQVSGLTADLAARAQLAGATFTGYLAPAVVTLSQSAGAVAVNAALGNDFRLTLTASGWTISNPANPVDGQIIEFQLAQDATGSRTVSWGTAYDFGTAGSPTLTTTASKMDLVGFKYRAASSKWVCMGSALGFAA